VCALRICRIRRSSRFRSAKCVESYARVLRTLHGLEHHWSRRDLRSHNCVGFSGLGPVHEWTLHRDGRRLVVPVGGSLSGNQADALIEACADGLGVGMFLSYQVASLVAQGRLKLLLAESGWLPYR
jgi:DNA-binding transcriptional LysR family regulator